MKRGSAEYNAWRDMKTRCTNRNYPGWQNYGGRGISVCDEWKSDFPKFFAHVGPRPRSDFVIDRINNDGNYEPGNVRWTDRTTSAFNTRRSKVKSDRKTSRKCKCGNARAYYGKVGGYSVRCAPCNAKNAAWQRANRAKLKRLRNAFRP